VYNFSSFLNNNTFTIEVFGETPQLVTIIDGLYNPTQLETYLNSVILHGVKVKYDTIDNKFYFYGPPKFNIDFTILDKNCAKNMEKLRKYSYMRDG
jgi:hypothetical protein